MPYANEHACRIQDPGDFQKDSFRRIERGKDKKLSIIVGRPKGQDTTATQAFRYPKDTWTEAEARAHCKKEGGRFEAAKKEKADLADGMAEISLVITKASLQDDGTMRWQATVSDTGPDKAGERTSLALFQDWIERAETGKTVDFLPPPRVPFLGISHYPALDGEGEAGITEKMYIDGKQFKVSGFFHDNPVGKALFAAVRSELEMTKKGETVEKPIRISAAWWDLEHSHGNFIFTRHSLTETCPMCAEGATSDKQFLKGQADHWASTRVPLNPRTALGLEEKSMPKITRREDAASIVGDELADELEGETQKLVGKSEGDIDIPGGLIVKADEPDVQKTIRHEGDKWILYSKDGKKKLGTFDTEADAKEREREINAIKHAKSDASMEEWKPLGGATSLEEAESFMKAEERVRQVYDNWYLFDSTFHNIMSDDDLEDKVGAVSKLVSEFGDRVQAIKANVSDAFLIAQSLLASSASPPATDGAGKGENIVTDQATQAVQKPQTEPQVNDPAAVLGTAVKAALEDPKLTREKRLEAIQEALNSYAGAVKAQLDAVAPPAPGQELADAIEKSMGGLAAKLDLLIAKLDNRASAPTPGAVPQQKSFTPAGPVQPTKASLPVSPVTGQPSGLRALIERSVGMHQ